MQSEQLHHPSMLGHAGTSLIQLARNRCRHQDEDLGYSRITIHVLILIDGLSQLHVLIHKNDGEDLAGLVGLVALSLVEVQAGVEAHLTYNEYNMTVERWACTCDWNTANT